MWNSPGENYLLLSVWLKKPEDAMRFDNVNFEEAPPFVLPSGQRVACRVDRATQTFLRARQVIYGHRMFRHDPTGTEFPKITSLKFNDNYIVANAPEPPVEFELREFLERYLSSSRMYSFEGERHSLTLNELLDRYLAAPADGGSDAVAPPVDTDDDEEEQSVKRRA